MGVHAIHVNAEDNTEPVLQQEKRITLELMRNHVQLYGEDAWRSVAGAGYSMPHQIAGKPRELTQPSA